MKWLWMRIVVYDFQRVSFFDVSGLDQSLMQFSVNQ